MTTHKRKRGRPLGSCKDDSHLLAQVADILLSDRKLKPTTAIKRVLASPDPSPIRRLQSKWRQEGSAYLEKAQNRAIRKAQEIMSREKERVLRELAETGFTGLGAYPTFGGFSAMQEKELRIREIMMARRDPFASLRDGLGLSQVGATRGALEMDGSLVDSKALKAMQEAIKVRPIGPIEEALRGIKRGY